MQTEEIVGFRLSPQQRLMWRLLGQNGAAQALECSVRIGGELDAERLRRAIGVLMARYEILRTRFECPHGMAVPLQVIEDSARFSWNGEGCEGAILSANLAAENGWSRLDLRISASCGDITSAELLVREIAAVYAGAALDDSPIQYADLAAWLNETAEQTSEGRDFWVQAAQNDREEIQLCGVNFAGSALPLHRVAARDASLTCWTALTRLTQRLDSPAESVLLACWVALLSRLTLSGRLPLGVTMEGRSYEGMDRTIGLLERQVPFSVQVSGDETLHSLVDKIGAQLTECSNWQEYFNWDDGGRVGRAMPAFGFAYRALSPQWREANLTWEVRSSTGAAEPNVMALRCILSADGLVFRLHYDEARLSPATAESLLRQFETLLLEAAQAVDGTLVSDLNLVGKEEEAILALFNATQQNWNSNRTVLSLFEEQAAKTPGHIALVTSVKNVTYAELDQRANGLAHKLIESGAHADQVIGMRVDRGVSLIVTMLAIWKAGAAYMPLDDCPAGRLSYMLTNSRARLVVAGAEDSERFSGHNVVVISPNEAGDFEPVNATVEGANLAYVIYTSGSTGEPKGVMVEHRSLVNHMLWALQNFGLGERERVLFKTSISFDASVWEWLLPLLQGGALIMAAKDMQSDVQYLLGQLRTQRITTLQVVPSMLRALVDDPEISKCADLQRIFAGGEALDSTLTQHVMERTCCKLINLYGPTEATIDTTSLEMRPEFRAAIGRPVANTTVHVLRPDLKRAAIGEAGELSITGAALARGYIGRPEDTAAKYIPDPYGGAGERLYRSGDMARYRADGVLEFLGRKDGQVKIRGYRIELGEVERAVQEQPFVLHTAVVAKQRLGGERYLAAYVELTAGAPLDAVERVRVGVRVRLPEYMCPGVFVVLASFPRTGSGKLDRRSLPEPEAMESAGGYTAPRTTGEATLAGIWATVLGVERVSVTANFFEIGGDSIIGIQIVARARQAGIGISPRQLFQHQTIAELAAAAPQRPGRQTAEDAVETGELPLTPIQHLFFATPTDNLHHFNQAFLFEVREEIRAELLEKALGKLVAQHDALRLRFRRTAEGWRQRYAAVRESPVRLERREIAEGENWDGALRKAIAEAHKSLNIERGPLVRMTWFDLGERGRRLHVVIHHLAVDGVSWRILAEDLETIYRELAEGEETKGLVRTSSYGQWAKGLAGYASGTALEKELGYWRREQERVVEAFVADMPLGENTVRAESRLERVLEAGETRRLLSEAGKAYHTQVMELLLSAMAEGLHGWRGHRRVRVELEGHGREEVLEGVDLTRTVGWFTSVYPVVLEWREGEREGDRIGRVKEQMRGIPNKGLGYGILRYLKAGSGLEGECALVMNYLGQFDGAIGREAWLPAAREGSGPGVGEGRHRGAEMELNAMVIEGRLQMAWSYSGERWRRETVEALADAFEDSLHTLIDHCLSPDAGAFTSADFTDFNWRPAELESLAAAIRKVS